MSVDDLIQRGDVLALPPYDGDGDPAGQWDHHIFVRLDAIAALPAAQPAPEVAALVGALRIIDAFNPERHINELSADAARGLVLRMGELARATLAATKKPLSMT
jgi:hypothetical protein